MTLTAEMRAEEATSHELIKAKQMEISLPYSNTKSA